MQENLYKVIETLNCIEVKGKGNLDMLLGCIMTLESIVAELTKEEVHTDG